MLNEDPEQRPSIDGVIFNNWLNSISFKILKNEFIFKMKEIGFINNAEKI